MILLSSSSTTKDCSNFRFYLFGGVFISTFYANNVQQYQEIDVEFREVQHLNSIMCIIHVFVSGEAVLLNGELTGKNTGKVLRK